MSDEPSEVGSKLSFRNNGRKVTTIKRLKHLGFYCLLLTFWMSAAFARPFEDVQAAPCPMNDAKDHGANDKSLDLPDCCKDIYHKCSDGSRFGTCTDGANCHGGVATAAMPTAGVSSFEIPARSPYPPHAEHGPPPGTTDLCWRPPVIA